MGNKYIIDKSQAYKIGEGVYTDEYKIYTIFNNKTYAGKFFKVFFANMGREVRYQYEKELKILQVINHPFCLKFIEKILYNDHVCFITEYYPHGDLEKLILKQKTFRE